LFDDLDGRRWIRRRSDTGAVLGRHSELVDHVRLEALERVGGVRDLVVGRFHPLDAALDAVFQHVVGDLGSAVRLGRLPLETGARLQSPDDLQRQRLARLLCTAPRDRRAVNIHEYSYQQLTCLCVSRDARRDWPQQQHILC